MSTCETEVWTNIYLVGNTITSIIFINWLHVSVLEMIPLCYLMFLTTCGTGSSNNLFLDWNKRFNIIEGIAQGLVYLHKYSRMRIIHLDMKASNVLLDEQMNPKIGDFGLSRILADNEEEANTDRIVGT